MSYEVSGKLKVKKDTQTFSSGFEKREFVITTDEKFPQDIKLEFVKDKCSLLDSFDVGQDVKVSWNLRGNEYGGKYYVNLQAWRIEKATSGEYNVERPDPGQPLPSQPQPTDIPDDDLPF